MQRFLALVILCLSSTASADPHGSFASGGLVLSVGSRGLAIGIEVSAGYYSNQSGAYGGAAAGVDYAPRSDLPVRAYAEAEGGWVAFGAGIGPAFFFDGKPPGLQVTPYVAVSSDVASCDDYEPFGTGGAFYRYTRHAARNLHEGGAFGKALWFVNGERDNGVCTH